MRGDVPSFVSAMTGNLFVVSAPSGAGKSSLVSAVLAELERRLRARGQDTEEAIQRRLHDAREEISHVGEFDYVIINKEFEEARRDLAAIVQATRLTLSRQSANHPEIFKTFR